MKGSRRGWSWYMAPLMGLGMLATASMATQAADVKRFKKPKNVEELGKLIDAKAALLVDARTGYILFERKIDDRHPPASVVKLMTALIAYEQTGLEGIITVQKSDTQVEPSHVPLKVGEKVPVKDITLSVLVGSDNDSAKALGRHVAGSDKAFVELMNRRAQELGCRNTKFANANGLPHKEHYISARDLIKIFQVVIQVPALRQVCQEPYFFLKTEVGRQRVKNHNKLLGKYPGMGPAKTGWTIASRHTYAAEASRDGHVLHLALLNSKNKWIDAQLLFDYGFERLKEAAAEQARILASAPTPLAVPNDPPTETENAAPTAPETSKAESSDSTEVASSERPPVQLLPKTTPPGTTAPENTAAPSESLTSATTSSPGATTTTPPPVALFGTNESASATSAATSAETSATTPAPLPSTTPTTASEPTSNLPQPEHAEPPSPAAQPIVMKEYTVRSGDTLWRIGKKHKVSWKEIISANNLDNPDKIKPGDVLLIPEAETQQ